MLDDGRLDPLAVVTMCDTMPGAVSERMGRRNHMYLPPSCDLTVHVLDDAHTEWVLAVNRARYAGDGLRIHRDGDLGRDLRAPRGVRHPADVLRVPRRPSTARGAGAAHDLSDSANRGVALRSRRSRSFCANPTVLTEESRCDRGEAAPSVRIRQC